MSSSRQFAIMSLHGGQKYYHEVCTNYLSHSAISSIVSGKGSRRQSRSPFQRQLPILQNTINNCHTLRDNFPQGLAETFSQMGASCSYVVYMLSLQNMYPSRDILTIKRLIF